MKSTRNLFAAAVACVSLLSPAAAQSPANEFRDGPPHRINAANALVRAGKIAEAIADYQQVQVTDDNRDELNYNLAVAEYRDGNLESAKARFSETAASPKTSIAARSRYNLGNCFFSDAVKAAGTDKPAAIAALLEAIGHYRGSLTVEPNHTDARANIELAVQLLRKLQDEQKQNEQQQDQQQNDQQQKEQNSEESPSGKSETGEKQSNSDDQQQATQTDESEQNPSQEPNPEQPQQPQENEAEGQESQGGNSKEQPSENDDRTPGQTSQDQTSQDQAEQNSAGKPQPQPASQQSASDQQPADETAAEQGISEEESTAPIGELTASGGQQSDGAENGRVGLTDPNLEQGLMTKEEALKMLQAVRDRDMLRRLRREQVERGRHIPTERDW